MSTYEITIDPALLNFTVQADDEYDAERLLHEAVFGSSTIREVE
jgi:hypothetical protein|tara:strand:- start:669 stop:800 length:132 start_codon:yes stop_codon:yes gene_type:complete